MPGIANCTVPRLRAQPGSLLSLLPVQNVKDQPVGGSRREQKHTITRVHTHTCSAARTRTHKSVQRPYAYTRIDAHRQTRSHSDTSTLRPGSLWYHIMRAPARPSHEASAEMIQGSPLGPHSISQVELHSRMTAELQHSKLGC